ncbi:MAG TPA: VOC family protein [Candidatus Dormibacteraeota bacterium]|nr:VOC family protein [Candidatus Dormibacteraeota bacterium]
MESAAPSGWPLSGLGLKVLNLELEVRYYQRLGFRLLDLGTDHAILGFADQPKLHLRRLPGGRARPHRTAGLYHFALLLPDARRLGQFLWRCSELGIPLDGASDHLVSQAIYLSDPEGNGIEVYADRPADQWTWTGDQVAMAVDPLDLEALMGEGRGKLEEFPADSRLGHVHLTVADLDRSVDFYRELGMDLTAGFGPFRFVSWERYHHHLGINLLGGPGAERVADDVAGLEYFRVARPQLEPGSLLDPDGVRVEITP